MFDPSRPAKASSPGVITSVDWIHVGQIEDTHIHTRELRVGVEDITRTSTWSGSVARFSAGASDGTVHKKTSKTKAPMGNNSVMLEAPARSPKPEHIQGTPRPHPCHPEGRRSDDGDRERSGQTLVGESTKHALAGGGSSGGQNAWGVLGTRVWKRSLCGETRAQLVAGGVARVLKFLTHHGWRGAGGGDRMRKYQRWIGELSRHTGGRLGAGWTNALNAVTCPSTSSVQRAARHPRFTQKRIAPERVSQMTSLGSPREGAWGISRWAGPPVNCVLIERRCKGPVTLQHASLATRTATATVSVVMNRATLLARRGSCFFMKFGRRDVGVRMIGSRASEKIHGRAEDQKEPVCSRDAAGAYARCQAEARRGIALNSEWASLRQSVGATRRNVPGRKAEESRSICRREAFTRRKGASRDRYQPGRKRHEDRRRARSDDIVIGARERAPCCVMRRRRQAREDEMRRAANAVGETRS
ncbi:hypothetical protein C8Q74DRAFT_1219044 [Fomes fomentarius]|nr:hypothetical protein C8Q74DRAFT_1219044 [Fomes fomentarius]